MESATLGLEMAIVSGATTNALSMLFTGLMAISMGLIMVNHHSEWLMIVITHSSDQILGALVASKATVNNS